MQEATQQDRVLCTAAREWAECVGRIWAGDAPLELAVEPGLEQGRYIAAIAAGRASVRGARPKDVLHGVYALLEQLGYVFTVRGPVAPDLPPVALPEVSLDQTAFLQRRGIRQHINFPRDISGYPLAEAKDYIRNLARMQMTDLVFHLYEACGWFQVPMPGYVACTRDDNPQPTFFYTERQLVPEEPAYAAVIRNRKVFCPPEAEPLYGTKKAAEFQHYFLSALIDEARAFGLHVGLSAEPHVLDHIAVGTFPDIPRDIDLMIRTTMELVNQMAACYPQVDEYELISRENVQIPDLDPVEQARFEFGRLLPEADSARVEAWIDEVKDGIEKHRLPFWDPVQMLRTLPHTLQSLYVARTAFERAQAHPQLGPKLAGKALSIGLYNGNPGMSHVMAEVMHLAIPEQYGLCWIPAHGAERVNGSLERMALPPAALERLRIYSWDELDGTMYSVQHPERNLRENVMRAGGGTPSQARGLLINHWRNAENEISLSAFARFTQAGVTHDAFAADLASRLWGVADSAAVRKLLDDLEVFQNFHINSNASAGFCFYPCWLINIDTMDWAGDGITHADIEKSLAMNEALLRQVEALRGQAGRCVGIERLTTLHTFLLATRDHFHTRTALLKMHELRLAQKEAGGEPTRAAREAFQAQADAALDRADAWMRTMLGAVVDRGVEGNLVSYAHVIKRFIRHCAGLYGTAAPLDDSFTPSVMDAPPLLS